ncbi:MAG: M20/M25/M40 family metallo-hydrolase [Pyrinomonadaceae bacterium]
MRHLKRFHRAASLVLIQSFILSGIVAAQTGSQTDVNAAIRKEGMENSKIMNTLHYLTDLHGPRLTGSPNHVAAAKWAAREMQSWGFENTALEPWEFGHPGWVNERSVGLMTKPVQDTLTFEVLAWTPGTKGAVTAGAFHIVLPERPTQDELNAYFASVKDSVGGRIVLVGRPAVIPVSFDPPNKRISDEEIRRRMDPSAAGPQRPPFTIPTPPTPKSGALPGAEVQRQLNAFLVANKVAVRVNDAAREHGQIRAFSNSTYDVKLVVPTVVMRNEDFGRIARLLAAKTEVRLEFDIRNRTVPDGVTSYNVVGEVVGSDKKDEVIMLGGHLDSWHSATGATDNAIGCAIMMEAARILKALNLKPRRTVRVALWSGEEQGLLGSQAYVKRHFGTAEAPGPDYGKFGGYFNIDSGTGRARGMSVFGPGEASTVLREALASFADYGFAGVTSSRGRGLGGSDHTSFNNAGLPGIGVNQDPIEYGTHTWHTNLDTYERIIEDDVKKAAIVIAAGVYALAMRDEMLPRFAADTMPAAPTPAPTPAASPSPTPRP